MLTSVGAGILAALLFTVGTLALTRASRDLGTSAVAIAMGAGLVLNLGVIAVLHIPPPTGSTGWLLAAGVLNATALTLIMRAVRLGKVGLVTAIVSTEGAIAALLASASGEALPPLVWPAIAIIVVGLLATSYDRTGTAGQAGRGRVSIGLALAGALAAGSALFVIGRLSQSVALAWAVLPPRLVGVFLLGVPLLASRRFQWSTGAAGLAALGGACELLGFFAFGWGSQGSVAITAILATLYASFSAIGAFILWRERLSPGQIAGMAVLVLGVAALTAVAA